MVFTYLRCDTVGRKRDGQLIQFLEFSKLSLTLWIDVIPDRDGCIDLISETYFIILSSQGPAPAQHRWQGGGLSWYQGNTLITLFCNEIILNKKLWKDLVRKEMILKSNDDEKSSAQLFLVKPWSSRGSLPSMLVLTKIKQYKLWSSSKMIVIKNGQFISNKYFVKRCSVSEMRFVALGKWGSCEHKIITRNPQSAIHSLSELLRTSQLQSCGCANIR